MAIVLNHPKIAKAQEKKAPIEMPIGESSFLQQANYDPENMQLTIIMKNGGQYVYSPFSPDDMQDFMESKDKDRFYSDDIKKRFQGSTRVVNKTVGKAVKK